MAKKQRQVKKTVSRRASSIQYFYILGGLLILAGILGAVFSPIKSSEVLSARDGMKASNADTGNITIGDIDEEVNIRIEANGGEKIILQKNDKARKVRKNPEGSRSGEEKRKPSDLRKRVAELRERANRRKDKKQNKRENRKEQVASDVTVIEAETIVTKTPQKFLGLVPVTITEEIVVYEENKDYPEVRKSLWDNILDVVSF